MKKKLSKQQSRILRYCQEFGGITAWEAAKELGVLQLSARICELKDMGFNIADKWIENVNRYGDKVRYKCYIVLGGSDD